MKKHHGQRNSFKGKHLVGAGLQFQGVSLLSSCEEACEHAGRHGAGEGAETKPLGLAWDFETSVSAHNDTLAPRRPHLLQSSHIS